MEPGKKFKIIKEKWYKNDIERIRRNLKRSKGATVLCIAIETGIANIAMLSDYSLTPIAEVKQNIPGKRYGKQNFDKAMDKFFSKVLTIVDENIERNEPLLIIACGPGFTKEEFSAYFKSNSEALKNKSAPIRDVNASSGELSGVYEIIRNGSISSQKTDFRFARQAEFMAKFVEHLGKQDGLCMYGLDEVIKAATAGAIEILLITDSLLRTADLEKREKIEEALNNTELQGGEVHILSTQNPPGQQLESYGNVAAILRYRLDY